MSEHVHESDGLKWLYDSHMFCVRLHCVMQGGGQGCWFWNHTYVLCVCVYVNVDTKQQPFQWILIAINNRHIHFRTFTECSKTSQSFLNPATLACHNSAMPKRLNIMFSGMFVFNVFGIWNTFDVGLLVFHLICNLHTYWIAQCWNVLEPQPYLNWLCCLVEIVKHDILICVCKVANCFLASRFELDAIGWTALALKRI